MKINMYTVYDSAVKAFVQPFFQIADAAAIRLFMDQVNNPETNIAKHPDQYTLFKCGVYDDSSGMLIPETPVSLGNGKQFVDQPKLTAAAFQDLLDAHLRKIGILTESETLK